MGQTSHNTYSSRSVLMIIALITASPVLNAVVTSNQEAESEPVLQAPPVERQISCSQGTDIAGRRQDLWADCVATFNRQPGWTHWLAYRELRERRNGDSDMETGSGSSFEQGSSISQR